MTGLSDFRDFFKSFVGLIGAGVATTALVLVIALVDLAPPWPPSVVELTAVGQLIALVLVYQFMKRASKKRINRRMMLSLLLLVFFALFYLSLHSLLVFEMPNGEFSLKGFVCSKDAATLYANSCPLLSKNLIAEAEFSPDRLWTPLSLMAARVTLIFSWIGMFSSIVVLVALFVVYQRRVT